MRSEITIKGLPESLPFYGSQNYLYGLSDFWSTWFEDQEVTERLLEVTSYQLADIYSKFIQLCTTSSLFDIRSTFHSSIKLLLIDSDDLVTGQFGNVYKLKDNILDARYLLDKPLAATASYEKDVHFGLSEDGSTINFYKPLSEMKFSSRRILKNGVEVTQYSIWATDVEIDEQALFKYFGTLVRVSPQTSTEVYRAYIQGLFYLYTQGPTVELLKRGVHLALGIPLARAEEAVLLIRQDDQSGDYIVVTELNSYRLPYGTVPSVEVGEVLIEGAELSTIATLVDYTIDDNWWINLSLPSVLFPDATGVVTATPGSFEDYAMRNYLKHHTFLVKVTLSGSLTSSAADEILRLVQDARPRYTMAINVWSVPIETEELREEDPLEGPNARLDFLDQMLSDEYLTRNHLEVDIAGERGGRQWIRSNGKVGAATSVDVTHIVNTTIQSGVTTPILDSHLVPLFNLDWVDLSQMLSDLGVTYSFPSPHVRPQKSFLITPVNLIAKYAEVVLAKTPIGTLGGISYNLKEFSSWVGEMNRVFVPTLGEITATDTLVIFPSVEDIYSMFLYRPSGNTIFNPVYFPPGEEDVLTVTQVPI